jgi:hypothetical protein
VGEGIGTGEEVRDGIGVGVSVNAGSGVNEGVGVQTVVFGVTSLTDVEDIVGVGLSVCRVKEGVTVAVSDGNDSASNAVVLDPSSGDGTAGPPSTSSQPKVMNVAPASELKAARIAFCFEVIVSIRLHWSGFCMDEKD